MVLLLRNTHSEQSSELFRLRTDKISSITVKPTINPERSNITFDQNQTVILVHALNNGIELPQPNQGQIISLELTINLLNGKQIIIGDYGEAEFLVTINSESKPPSFMIFSTDLKEILLPYQDLFKREISLKKNISQYGTERITGYMLEDTTVYEETSNHSEEVFKLKQGNIIRTLAKKTSHGVEWIFIDTVAFDLPNPVGWIESTKITTQQAVIKPNEGFIQEVNLYAEPSLDSLVLQKNLSGAVKINGRVGYWTHCSFAGGLDGWIEENNISYTFPAEYDMGY